MNTDKNLSVNRHNYFSGTLRNTQETIDNAKRALRDVDFDTFVVTGLSGAIAGGLLAHALDKHLLVIRKDDDLSTHDGSREFGSCGSRWVFLDDFIETGRTLERVIKHMKTVRMEDYTFGHTIKTTYVGRYLYQGWGADNKKGDYEEA